MTTKTISPVETLRRRAQSEEATQQAFSIDQFCGRNLLSRGMLYKLWKQGKGPRYLMVGAVRRITAEQERDWHRSLEVRPAGQAA